MDELKQKVVILTDQVNLLENQLKEERQNREDSELALHKHRVETQRWIEESVIASEKTKKAEEDRVQELTSEFEREQKALKLSEDALTSEMKHLRSETERLTDENDRKNKILKHLEDLPSGKEYVDLNVGGVLFTVSKASLLSIPFTFFTGLLSDRFGQNKDHRGALLINRSSLTFPFILQYLTEGVPFESGDFDKIFLRLLIEDVEFYGLSNFFVSSPTPKLLNCDLKFIKFVSADDAYQYKTQLMLNYGHYHLKVYRKCDPSAPIRVSFQFFRVAGHDPTTFEGLVMNHNGVKPYDSAGTTRLTKHVSSQAYFELIFTEKGLSCELLGNPADSEIIFLSHPTMPSKNPWFFALQSPKEINGSLFLVPQD